MNKRVQVIVNPTAGQDQPILGVLNRVFHEAGVAWDVSITNLQARDCPQCGVSNPATANFCMRCGSNLNSMRTING